MMTCFSSVFGSTCKSMATKPSGLASTEISVVFSGWKQAVTGPLISLPRHQHQERITKVTKDKFPRIFTSAQSLQNKRYGIIFAVGTKLTCLIILPAIRKVVIGSLILLKIKKRKWNIKNHFQQPAQGHSNSEGVQGPNRNSVQM